GHILIPPIVLLVKSSCCTILNLKFLFLINWYASSDFWSHRNVGVVPSCCNICGLCGDRKIIVYLHW
ncbi:16111_t:CDS:1, partial [Racocetra persica]